MTAPINKGGRRSVTWRSSGDSADLIITPNFVEDIYGRSTSDAESLFEISQWPSCDPVISKRHSNLRLNRRWSSRIKLISVLRFACCTFRKKKPIVGMLEGPKMAINTSVSPIDYFSEYHGRVDPHSIALVGLDGKTSYTFEELNSITDHFAKVLKPEIDEKLVMKAYAEDNEPSIAVAVDACDKRVIVILSIWKLGLSYLPIRIIGNPDMRIAAVIDSLKPLLLVGMDVSPELEDAFKNKCRFVNFESLWDATMREMRTLKQRSFDANKRAELLIDSLPREDPTYKCAAVFHRFSPNGDVTPTYIRNVTIWNRVHAEWKHFPYTKDEKVVAIYNSVDSQDFLGQFLTPLLAGNTTVAMNALDLFGFLENVHHWKIGRLTVYPELLRAFITIMELIVILQRGECEATTPPKCFDSVKYWFCTGATMRRHLAIAFFKTAPPHASLVNLYGSKEVLGFGCFELFTSIKDIKYGLYYDIVPMGRPVINTRMYILDQNHKITSGSAQGEIYMSGLAVTSHTGIPHLSSCSDFAGDKYSGPLTVENSFFKERKDDPMFKTILRTGDFGRFVYTSIGRKCCGREKITTQFSGQIEGEVTIENYRLTTNEILRDLKNCVGVKGCHVMVYRPGTASRTVLAFVVISQKNPVSKEDVHIHLRKKIPEYMMPVLVFIPGIPIKNFKINKAQLVDYYQREIYERGKFDDYEQLGFEKDSPRWKAARTLFNVLFNVLSIGKQWAATHLDWTLAELHIPYVALPKVLKDLMKHGYRLDMRDFFGLNSLNNILHLMVATQFKIYTSTSLPALRQQQTEKYRAEMITKKHVKEMNTFFTRSTGGSRYPESIPYYSGMLRSETDEAAATLWPLIILKPYSVAIRSKRSKKIVAAVAAFDHYDKEATHFWSMVRYPVKYLADVVDGIDADLEEQGLISRGVSGETLQALCYLADPITASVYESSIEILELAINEVIKTAQSAKFKALYLIIVEYYYVDFVREAFGFKTIDYRQVNLFEAADGTKPFHLVPDNICATVLHKTL